MQHPLPESRPSDATAVVRSKAFSPASSLCEPDADPVRSNVWPFCPRYGAAYVCTLGVAACAANEVVPRSIPYTMCSVCEGLRLRWFVPNGTNPGGRGLFYTCLLYTSDAADEEDSVVLGGRSIIKKKKTNIKKKKRQIEQMRKDKLHICKQK